MDVGGESDIPGFSESFAGTGIIESGLSREELRRDTHVHRTLFIDLLGHGGDATAWLPQFSGDPG